MKMKANLKQLQGLAFMGISDTNHWVAMDAPEPLGGFGGGSRPMELILMGVAGCSAMDVYAILKKKRVDVRGFDVEVDSDKADEHPQVFTQITLKYIITGKGVQAKDVERAIELTDDKYCGAIAMIRNSVRVTHEYEIKESD